MIELLGKVASTFFQGDVNAPNAETLIAEQKTPTKLNGKVCKNIPFFVVVLEVVLALRRLVDSEMVSILRSTLSLLVLLS